MQRHKKVLSALVESLKKKNLAVLVTGSVARGDALEHSDLDLLVISKKGHSFKERTVEGILVEIRTNTIHGFIKKMDQDPMNIYQWLDAQPEYDPDNILPHLKDHAQKIFDGYSPIKFPKKWLKSAKKKIESARVIENKLVLSFHTSNSLWKVVEGFYFINAVPLPPSSTAFKKIKTLKKLPENFEVLWEQTLTGDLDERAHTLLLFIEFIQKTQGV